MDPAPPWSRRVALMRRALYLSLVAKTSGPARFASMSISLSLLFPTPSLVSSAPSVRHQKIGVVQSVAAVMCCLALVACPAPGPEPEPDLTPPAGFNPDDFEIIEYNLTEKDSEAYRGENDAELVFHVQRFALDTPMRIHAVGATFNVRGDDDKLAHLALYPDRGHNFFDFVRDAPLASWDLDLNKADHDEVWQVFPLDEVIEIPHPQLVYLGSEYRGEPGQPVLATDDELSVDPFLLAHDPDGSMFAPSLAVMPDRGVDSGGFEVVSFANYAGPLFGQGDLMVRLYVERINLTAPGDEWFTDTTDDSGAGLAGSGNPSFGDCNNDGWEDVWDGRLRLNNGDGTFSDMTDSSGIGAAGAAAWGDYNNDGEIDIFFAAGADQLYEGQGDCLFVNVTAASGIDDTQLMEASGGGEDTLQQAQTPSAAWVDVDGDGLLDLMQANYESATGDLPYDYLWMNQGDGLFVNATEERGMLTPQGSGRAGRGVAPADWDNDGDLDIYISNYRLQRNLAWQNDGSGHFENIAPDNVLGGLGNETGFMQFRYGHTIGSVWGDVDGDGDLDLFCANLAHPRFIRFSNKSMLLRNRLVEDGVAAFEDVAQEAGMLYQETDSSPVFLDYDNDGHLDLFYTAVYPARPSYLYRNRGDWTFSMVSYPAGTWIYGGWGVSSADLDNDGDMDLYGGRFLRNDYPGEGGWLKVRVVGSGQGATNRSGLGVRLRLSTDAGNQTREVQGGIGVSSGASLVQHFGLGEASAGSLEVSFPASGIVVSTDIESGQTLTVHENGTIDVH